MAAWREEGVTAECLVTAERPRGECAKKRSSHMLETIAIILVVLWLLGFVTSYTMGGFIHALLIIAVVVILVRVIQGRRV